MSVTNFWYARGGGGACWSNRLEKLSQELGDIVGVVGVDGAVTQDGVAGLGDQAGAGYYLVHLARPQPFL